MNIKEEFNQKTPVLFYTVVLVVLTMFLISFYFLVAKRLPVKKSTEVVNESISLPLFSAKSGFYTDEFEVELHHPDENAVIYYTLDGSIPSIGNAQYNEPLKINKLYYLSPNIEDIPTSPIWDMPADELPEGVVIRASAYVPGKGMGKSITNTYFISSKIKNNYQIPIVSITAEKDDLFDNKKGIYVMGENYYDKKLYYDRLLEGNQWWKFPANYHQRGSRWQKDANLEYLIPGSKEYFSSDITLKIVGGVTRAYPQKSLSFEFVETVTGFPFFKNGEQKHYKSLILRSSGQDWFYTLFRDGYFQSAIKEMELDVQDYQPVILFLNGKLWGLHNLREHWSVDNIALNYNCKPEEVILVEYGYPVVFTFKEREEPIFDNTLIKTEFESLLNFVNENRFTNDFNYNFIKSKIDVENFIDFIIAETYCANIDWPRINMKMFKINKGEEQGKWRFLLHDVDISLGNNGDNLDPALANQINMFDHLFQQKNEFVSVLFKKLLENNDFSTKFIERYNFHLTKTFKPQRMLTFLEYTQENISSYIPEHIDRWRTPKSFKKWEKDVEVVRNFIRKRPNIVHLHLKRLAENPLYYKDKFPQNTFTYKIE